MPILYNTASVNIATASSDVISRVARMGCQLRLVFVCSVKLRNGGRKSSGNQFRRL